ncbi:hypothetical protein CRG98_018863 [Punica granatum]|uniref:G-patch domain-containing protein n=1 Tax=Punica granatum TaxID=22663 RepID=A0A2I0JY43_PUNGR|nr:hypothetical protein CRG98_018863 [Punica granatum]
MLFLYSSNLIDRALAQVILQVVGGHSYVEAVVAETIRSLDYVREIQWGKMRGSPHLLQIWLLAHIRPFGLSHPFPCITDERSLIARLLHVFRPSDHNYTDWTWFMEELTPTQFLWTTRWNPGGPMIIGYSRHTTITLIHLYIQVLTTGVASISYSCTRKNGRRVTTRYLGARHATNAGTLPSARHACDVASRCIYGVFRGAYYSHLLAHTSSFSDLIEAGKKLDMGVKIGRIEGLSRKKDGETSKKQTVGTSRRRKDATIGIVNSGHQASQPISVDYTPALPTSQAYAHPGAPGHTLDTCWRLRDKIQEMIDTRRICANPLPDHGSGPGPSVNMISIAAIEEEEDSQKTSIPFVINYAPAEVAFASFPFVIEVHTKEPYQDSRVPWTYEGEVTDQEAEAFMKVIKASEYKVVEQMSKSPAHISLLSLLLSSEQHRDALLKVLTAAQVPKNTTPERIEETVSSIFSNKISFSEDEIPSEGQGHLRALHIVCKCNNHVVGRVMIDNGSALNMCPVSTLKQMNVDMSRIRASKTTVRAFDGSRRDVNREIDFFINVGPCSFSVTFQILEIPNAFSLLLGRPWIHATGVVPSSLHQKLKFFVEGKLISVNDEEDYAVYKETTVPYISIGEDQNLPFHSFDTISVLLKNNYVPGTGLRARAQRILRPVEVEEYCNKRGLGFRPFCHEIVQPRRGKHLHRLVAHYGKLFRGIPVPPLSQFFAAPSQIMGGTSDSPITELDDFSSDAAEAFLALPAIYAVTEETSSRVHIHPVREDEELTN